MHNRVITEQQGEALRYMLSGVLVRADTEAVFVCDKGGNIVDHVSLDEKETDVTIAALASGSFAATGELAKLIGEMTFRSVYHKGENKSVYMQNLGTGFLILIVFGNKTTVGMVKLCLEKSVKSLEVLLGEMSRQTVQSSGANATFSMSSSDRVFKKKDKKG
jgi:predicted regulator of Ras-like GTPase activity (Roadblock/LC7/MglB family)